MLNAEPRLSTAGSSRSTARSSCWRRSPPRRSRRPAPALADRARLNRSTAWRILATLEHHGLVERDPATQPLPARLRAPAARGRRRPRAARAPRAPAAARGSPHDTGETANLAVARRLELVYADQVQAPHVMAPNWLGHAVPLHATSTGKAFLAALPPAELDALLRAPLERFTGTTITDPARAARRARRASARAATRSRAASSSRRCGASRAAARRRPPPCQRLGRRRARARPDRAARLARVAAARELETLLS